MQLRTGNVYLRLRTMDAVDIVFGGGRYGLEAVEHLIKEGRRFVVIDPDKNCMVMKKIRLPEFNENIRENSFLQGSVKELAELFFTLQPEFIFPTAPVHMAASFLTQMIELESWADGIDSVLSGIPPKIILSAGKGTVVVSYNRDHDCIPNCRAPDVCPVTKVKKPAPMYEMLRFAAPDGFVVESVYLKPGLGAVRGEDLNELIEWAEGRDRILVGTACRCHGVLSSFRRV